MVCGACEGAFGGTRAGAVRPRPSPVGLPRVRAAVPYEGVVRAVLLAHKERGALPLAGVLGRALAGAVRAAAGPGGALSADGDAGPCPIPT